MDFQTITGYPLHRENRLMAKTSLSGKTQGIWNFCQNTGKTPGILFAQVAGEISGCFRSWIYVPSQFCVCDSHKSQKLPQGKICNWTGKIQAPGI